MAELNEQIAQQVVGHGVCRVERQRPPQHPFGFRVAILAEECPRRAEASEASLRPRRRRPAETADRLVAMAQRVYQGAGAEPRLGQRRQQLGGTVVGQDCPTEIAQLLQGDPHAEVCVRVTRVAGDGALKCGDGVRHAADLQVGQAKVVLDYRVGRLQSRRFAQRHGSIARSPGPEQLGGSGKQRRDLPRVGLGAAAWCEPIVADVARRWE